MNKKTNLLKSVSEELNLSFETQDWGIINANPHRIEEFIGYFAQHDYLPKEVKYPFFDLIVASFNDAILESLVNKENESLFKEFIKKHSIDELYKPILDYWKRITNEEEFPVGKLLKKI